MTAITESKDVDFILVDELVKSLQSYELDLPKTSKSKSMALKSVNDVEASGFDDDLSAPQCFGCQGYGYMKSECPTYLRSKGKAMVVTINDDEVFDDESGCDEDENFIAFTAIAVVNESLSIEENPSDGELSEPF